MDYIVKEFEDFCYGAEVFRANNLQHVYRKALYYTGKYHKRLKQYFKRDYCAEVKQAAYIAYAESRIDKNLCLTSNFYYSLRRWIKEVFPRRAKWAGKGLSKPQKPIFGSDDTGRIEIPVEDKYNLIEGYNDALRLYEKHKKDIEKLKAKIKISGNFCRFRDRVIYKSKTLENTLSNLPKIKADYSALVGVDR